MACSIADYFYELCSLETRKLHTTSSNRLFIIQLLFFLLILCWFISHEAGKEKQTEKRSARSLLVKLGLQFKRTNCLNNRTISQDSCTLFARYFLLYFLQLDNKISCYCLFGTNNFMDYHFKAGSVSSCGVNDYRKKRQQLNINNNACRNNRIVSGYNLFQCYCYHFQF